eukprot:1085178_1
MFVVMIAVTTECNATKTSKIECKQDSILVEFLCLLLLGSKRSKELELLVVGLESSMSELGGGIDELDVDNLEVLPGGLNHHDLRSTRARFLTPMVVPLSMTQSSLISP